MSKCCKYHNNFFEAWIDAEVEQPTDLNDCGMAGMGAAVLCCENCPEHSFYVPDRQKPANYPSQRRPVEYIIPVIREYAKESGEASKL